MEIRRVGNDGRLHGCFLSRRCLLGRRLGIRCIGIGLCIGRRVISRKGLCGSALGLLGLCLLRLRLLGRCLCLIISRGLFAAR